MEFAAKFQVTVLAFLLLCLRSVLF